tara:strand:- start:504 stop:1088 length:585 start_codon:yes stop_codon:yes gene_type:complete
MTNVKQYTDTQLLERIEKIGGQVPNRGKYLAIGVQSQEDAFNLFDDKFYIYDGPDFKMVSTGTTNAGKTALKFFKEYNLPGAAVWRTNQWIKDCYIPGYHKGRMKALRQNKPIHYYRDSDMDDKAEEQGLLHYEIIWANMHGVDYDPFSSRISQNINGWSFACQVWNRMTDYRNMIKATWDRKLPVDYALLKEW